MAVSVVVPVRNGCRWLPACLDSLAAQQGTSFELIVVDDGSTDGSLELAQRHWETLEASWPLRCFTSASAGASRGVSAARNLGWRQAHYPLVAFLDADDLALPGRLALQAGALAADPELAHVMGGWRRFGPAGLAGGFDVCPWQEGAGFEIEAAFRLKAVLPSAWMLRRSALEAVGGFREGLSQAEDVDLLLGLALAGHRGSWVREIVCGYRVHGGSASQQLTAQSRSLLWVMHQRLAQLPPSHPLTTRKPELVFATRAWCAWQAWYAGNGELALALWQNSWGLSPLGPARTWLHLAEGIASHCQRIGASFEPADLLNDPHWQAFERFVLAWWQHLAQAAVPVPQAAAGTLDQAWSLLVFGHHQRGLVSLREQLSAELKALEGLLPQPAELAQWFCPPPEREPEPESENMAAALQALRREALAWLEQLLGWDGVASGVTRLIDGLHDLLCGWARLLWSHSLTPAVQRLELAFAIKPSGWLLEGLAELQASSCPTGSAALRQLAQRFSEGDGDGGKPCWPDREPLPPLGRCSGPNCLACSPALTPTADPFTLHQLPGGLAWLRPGCWSPWGTTTQVAVLDRSGGLQKGLSRRYPQPWSGCRQRASWHERPDPAWHSLHTDPPLPLEGAVLAVADLSAEVHYHWLLDQLPRLGLALAWWQQHHAGAPLTIWCNGATEARRPVVERLIAALGLPQPRWLAVDGAPAIKAEMLLVPPFLHPFGEPGPAAIGWLRQTLLSPEPGLSPEPDKADGPVLWLQRGHTSRRRALGETAVLALLQERGVAVKPVDLAALPLVEQARTMAGARMIVAPHGGALASLVFVSPGTPVLELHGPDYAPPYWQSLASVLQLRLHRLACPQAVPQLYRELVFGSALDAPILLEPQAVADAVAQILQDCSATPLAVSR